VLDTVKQNNNNNNRSLAEIVKHADFLTNGNTIVDMPCRTFTYVEESQGYDEAVVTLSEKSKPVGS